MYAARIWGIANPSYTQNQKRVRNKFLKILSKLLWRNMTIC
jgi:hypothetical protein